MTGKLLIVLALLSLLAPAARAQAPDSPAPRAPSAVRGISPESLVDIVQNARPDAAATLTVANREITVFRSTLLARSSANRVTAAGLLLEPIIQTGQPVKVDSHEIAGAVLVTVNGADIFAIVPTDVDELLGETLAIKRADAVARLQQALDEAITAYRPGSLLAAAGAALLATVAFLAVIWFLRRIHRRASGWVTGLTERALTSATVAGEIAREMQVVRYVRRVVAAALWLIGLFAFYLWTGFALRQFPYTRPWGESLRTRLLDRVLMLAHGIFDAFPALVTVLMIFVLTRLVVKMVHLLFMGIEQGRYRVAWIYPETATSTRKLMTVMLWLFALIVSYPYLPGSDTEAFKGVSVFVGLIVSLGSTGMMNQMMSGFTLTYSRALRNGDFIRAGDLDGTVVHIGTLSTKIETPRGEEVTIPNAVLVGQAIVNFSRNADTTGVYSGTSVGIGYDTPWRQVEALLLLAAERTPGVRRTPAPAVIQNGLEDFAVRYTVLVAVEEPRWRARVLTALHANILDAFNDHGIQIMTPAYEGDPEHLKVVPRERWFEAPGDERSPADAPKTPVRVRSDR